MRAMLCVLVVAACGGGESDPITPDAPISVDALVACEPVTADPLPAGRHTLYLATEGVSLTKAACDNAQADCTSLIVSSQTVPAFYATDSIRLDIIAQIVDRVETALAPYSIDVTTTRPASGDYFMIVVGGSAQALTGLNILSVAQGICEPRANGVSLVFQSDGRNVVDYASDILSNFGAMVGMAVVSQSNDCMCRTSGCTFDRTRVCTFGVDVPVAPDVHTCGRTTQNEPLLFSAALGCR